jgi:hypothetical protein
MSKLNSTALIFVTGNGLRISEDLARRFIEIRFDAGTEDPEARPFKGDILAEVTERRVELLAAVLTICSRRKKQHSIPSLLQVL